jgi:DNA topoisomerase VI subunit B
MSAVTKPQLERQTFTISRENEFFTEKELTTQTGYPRHEWFPRAVVKELVDNALDAAETAGTAPVITIDLDEKYLTVSDNGPGIPADVVKRTLDYASRTSDKTAYVSPTRGAQGNALKTILAIPYVLSGREAVAIEIEAQGCRHEIKVSLDHVAQKPVISLQTFQIVKTRGTTVRVPNFAPWLQSGWKNERFLLKRLVCDYMLFNPHAQFALTVFGDEYAFPATDANWIKWLPNDPTPPHWYTAKRLENLVLSYLTNERSGQAPRRTVREFCSEFRGFSGSLKQKQVIAQVGLERAYLDSLLDSNDRLKRHPVGNLLDAMKEQSNPVKPVGLGVLGEEHFRRSLTANGIAESFRYKRLTCFTPYDNLPFLAEVAFLRTEHSLLSDVHVGLNWSVPLSNPLPDLGEMLAGECWMEDEDPVCLIVHLACPSFNFTDRGKGRLSLHPDVQDAIEKTIKPVTAPWTAYKRKSERDARAGQLALERMTRTTKITIKAAAEEVIVRAYEQAAGRLRMANARQIMYVARPLILALTGNTTFDDKAFTQKLLPAFVREHPELTKDWDVIYDARGHLLEPHTGHQFGIGTLEVRGYLLSSSNGADAGRLSAPQMDMSFPTHGPKNRYATVLYVEKEGFMPLLQRARFAERYDLALCSSKGMGTTSLRDLFSALDRQHHVTILCLHDFDKSGFSIVGTLLRDTERYRHRGEPPRVIDLGLRLVDVEEMNLQSEPVVFKQTKNGLASDPAPNLKLNGATDAEIEFLRGTKKAGAFHGRRVELNAMTSDQFVEWLERKLKQHGIRKVVPDQSTLTAAYRRAAARRRFQDMMDAAVNEVDSYSNGLDVPADLREKIMARLERTPDLAWDDTIEGLLPREG